MLDIGCLTFHTLLAVYGISIARSNLAMPLLKVKLLTIQITKSDLGGFRHMDLWTTAGSVGTNSSQNFRNGNS